MKAKGKLGLVLVVTLLMGMLAVSCMGMPDAEGGGGSGLTVHYYRVNKDYEGWNVWMWPTDPGDNGDGYQFGRVDEEGWITAIVPLPSYVREYGFIIRKSVAGNEWEAKDTQDDRFSTDREIWVVSGNTTVYTSKPSVSR